MKKKNIVICSIITAVIVVIILVIVKEVNNGNILNGKIYIKISEGSIPPSTYTFNMNEKGVATFNADHSSSTIDGVDSENNYEIKFTKDELKDINLILNNIKEKSNIADVDGYLFYFESGNELKDDDYYSLLYCILAIDSICEGNELMDYYEEEDLNNDGKLTCREFGDSWLKEIIEEMLE